MYKINSKNKMNGLDLLKELDTESVKTVFFDPQYRGVLDYLHYGNEGRRHKARYLLPQMTDDDIEDFFKEIERVLSPSGYVFLWLDKYHLCEGVKKWLPEKTKLQQVDLVTWNKLKFGMGFRTRRKSEYLLILQKKPIIAKRTWSLHDIPDVWEEYVRKTHAHSKPVQLQKKLIEAVTDEGEIVVDPAAGGYSVLEACKLSKRTFIGCDIAA